MPFICIEGIPSGLRKSDWLSRLAYEVRETVASIPELHINASQVSVKAPDDMIFNEGHEVMMQKFVLL